MLSLPCPGNYRKNWFNSSRLPEVHYQLTHLSPFLRHVSAFLFSIPIFRRLLVLSIFKTLEFKFCSRINCCKEKKFLYCTKHSYVKGNWHSFCSQVINLFSSAPCSSNTEISSPFWLLLLSNNLLAEFS